MQGIVTASGQAAAAQTTMATAVTRSAMATQQADAHVIAHRANLERLATANAAAAAASGTAAPRIAAVGVSGRAAGAILSGLAGILGGLAGVIIGSVVSALVEMAAKLFDTTEDAKKLAEAFDTTSFSTYALSDAQGILSGVFDLTTGKIKTQTGALHDLARAQLLVAQAQSMGKLAEHNSYLSNVGSETGRTEKKWWEGGGVRDPKTGGYGLGWYAPTWEAKVAQGVQAGTMKPEDAMRTLSGMQASGNIKNETYTKLLGAVTGIGLEKENQKLLEKALDSLESGKLDSAFLKPDAAKKPPKGRSGGKTDAEKIADLVRNAEAEITVEQNRSKAVQMSAEAAAELEQRTKLLNAASSAGLKITPALTGQIDKLAAAYADAKVAADVAEVTKGVTDDIDKRRAALADEAKLIGLRGEAYDRARREMDAQRKLSDALPNGAIAVTGNLTGKESDEIEQNNRLERIARIKQAGEDAAYAMDLERRAIGLTGAAAIEYAYISERLIEAKRAGIELSPAEVAAINAAGSAYANTRYEVDKTAKSLADSREITMGFFSDWSSGVRESGNIFKSFADAAVNSINRIIDKLIEAAIQQMFFNSVAGASGGGGFLASIGGFLGFANGGAFGTAQKFAKGGAFTNQIVTSPTLFKFANGAAMGEMGEAGPEAIMPLTRGPDGKLGVQSHGGGRPSVRMGDVYLEIRLEGAMTPETVIAIAREAGEQAVTTIRRDFASIAAEYETNGAVVE
ncbi:phage tail tape measure protein [Sphingopyxis fribergensis]|uniref:phage tail tape measure protein n=1 Tax=Sphingopyxis fribergensis TaxID=1515612 RepID=UPI0011DCE7CB|nr:phage tail tape measure protein [Sphingopyxis fribergensis]